MSPKDTTALIWIIDDSDIDRFIAHKMLQKVFPNAQIRGVASGDEAMEELRGTANPPDLILLDLNMPGTDGFEFIEWYSVSHAGQLSPARVVVLTSSDASEDKRRVEGSRVVCQYLVKPLTPADILKLEDHLDPTTR